MQTLLIMNQPIYLMMEIEVVNCNNTKETTTYDIYYSLYKTIQLCLWGNNSENMYSTVGRPNDQLK